MHWHVYICSMYIHVSHHQLKMVFNSNYNPPGGPSIVSLYMIVEDQDGYQ